MPNDRYEASRRTIGMVLSSTSPRVEIPEWQRAYSWETSQIEAFWQDLQRFDGAYPDNNIIGEEYFLGSIVLVTAGPKNLLLDGQQRLATATILLSVLRDARRAYRADAATRLQQKYIAEFDDTTNATSYYLTMGQYDSEFFRKEIQDEPANPPIRPKPTLKSHALIRKARLYFEARVAEKVLELGGGETAFLWNTRIQSVLCEHMSLVAISSSDEDNAAAVFETLNDRGIGLSTPDLLRNFLLRRAGNELARERIAAAWRDILAIHTEADVDTFLRHYWISHYGDVRTTKLYREIKSVIERDNIDALTLSQDLADAAPIYRDLARAQDDDVDVQRNLQAIRQLGAKLFYPVLLSAVSATEEETRATQLKAITAGLITLFVRHNVIGGLETTVMEAKLYSAAASLRQDKDFNAALAAIQVISPDAATFVSAFRRASIGTAAIARYVLTQIEHAIRETQEVAVEGSDRVHLEHIYPQTPDADKWPNHAAVINRIGNLTLLSKRLNSSIKNSGFDDKKTKGYVNSDIVMTKDLLAIEKWDPAAIDTRQESLSQHAFTAWHFEGEAEPAAPAPEVADDEMQELAQLPEAPTG